MWYILVESATTDPHVIATITVALLETAAQREVEKEAVFSARIAAYMMTDVVRKSGKLFVLAKRPPEVDPDRVRELWTEVAPAAMRFAGEVRGTAYLVDLELGRVVKLVFDNERLDVKQTHLTHEAMIETIAKSVN